MCSGIVGTNHTSSEGFREARSAAAAAAGAATVAATAATSASAATPATAAIGAADEAAAPTAAALPPPSSPRVLKGPPKELRYFPPMRMGALHPRWLIWVGESMNSLRLLPVSVSARESPRQGNRLSSDA